MELGIKEEVKNIEELKVLLKDNKEISKDYQVAVIVYAFDEENRIIFQRRRNWNSGKNRIGRICNFNLCSYI